MMKISCYASSFLDIAEDAAVLFCHKSKRIDNELLEKIDILSGGAVREMYASGEFDGSAGMEAILHRVPETAAGRVILVGLGEKKDNDFDAFRQAAGRTATSARGQKLKTVALFYDGPATGQVIQALTEGFGLGSYRYLKYKTEADAAKGDIDSLALVVANRARLEQAKAAAHRAEIITWAVNRCRDLAGMPGNDLYPETFAGEVKKLAAESRFTCTVLGPAEIAREKMGALSAVAQGSDRTPRFVIAQYKGKANMKPVVLVGKGITFDSGGISIKPAQDMGEMKGDMTGAAVVLAVIAAAAKLKVKVNLVALIPLAENMPSGHASRPGDVITSRSGQTIEIISTDAEGRLILADALDYADRFKPQAVIDIATLTGAALYILGYAGAPFVGTSQTLNDRLRASAKATGEKLWELPLWPEFAEQIKSPIADIKNSGGRPAGTITAASFLQKFVKDWPWAHIDIAYCDVEPNGKPYIPKGPTGIGIRLLLDLIMNWKKI
jgi:leucyl aminopeptidase